MLKVIFSSKVFSLILTLFSISFWFILVSSSLSRTCNISMVLGRSPNKNKGDHPRSGNNIKKNPAVFEDLQTESDQVQT